jgi:hypothetical protein
MGRQAGCQLPALMNTNGCNHQCRADLCLVPPPVAMCVIGVVQPCSGAKKPDGGCESIVRQGPLLHGANPFCASSER